MISKDDEVDKLNYFEFYDEKGLTLSNITYYDFDEGVEEFLDRDLPLMNAFDQIGNQTISMPCSNSISEEISDAYFQNNMLSYEYVQNSKEKNWNGFINQGNRNINQSGFISNEEFENLFHYNNNFSFINDDPMYNEQISTKKRNFLVNATIIPILNSNILILLLNFDRTFNKKFIREVVIKMKKYKNLKLI